MDLAGTPPGGAEGRSKDEQRVGSGGLDKLFIDNDGLLGGIVFVLVSLVGVIEVTGLAGCDRLCSGAWNVYTVRGGLECPFS